MNARPALECGFEALVRTSPLRITQSLRRIFDAQILSDRRRRQRQLLSLLRWYEFGAGRNVFICVEFTRREGRGHASILMEHLDR
jgi:hypothetical protein